MAIYYSFFEYNANYIVVWFLNCSALLAPPLLLCGIIKTQLVPRSAIKAISSLLIALVSLIMLVNNIISIFQSILGKFHPLSVGAGGMLGAQIGTNTAIELRSPGLFTFATGNANFSIVCTLFLLASFGFKTYANLPALIRLLALLTLPISIIRSVSRTFLFGIILVLSPFLGSLLRYKALIILASFFFLCLLLYIFIPNLDLLLTDGISNFMLRILDAGGIYEGVVVRFFQSFISDAGGSDAYLINNLGYWFDADPLSMFFGYGLGFSTPLFRFVAGLDDTAYGFINLNGSSFLVGETAITSLLADIGLIGLVLYIIMVCGCIRLFLQRYRSLRINTSRAFALGSFLTLLYAFTLPYFRPANFLFLTSAVLLPSVCSFLFKSQSKLD